VNNCEAVSSGQLQPKAGKIPVLVSPKRTLLGTLGDCARPRPVGVRGRQGTSLGTPGRSRGGALRDFGAVNIDRKDVFLQSHPPQVDGLWVGGQGKANRFMQRAISRVGEGKEFE